MTGLEDMMMKFVSKVDTAVEGLTSSVSTLAATVSTVKAATEQNTASIQLLERQIGQIADALQSKTPGHFPSQPEKKPREQCNAIHLRSGKELIKDPTREPVSDNPDKGHIETKRVEVEDVELEDTTVDGTIDLKKPEEKDVTTPSKPVVNPYVPRIPFPNRLKAHKDEEQFKKFLDIFKKLHINIPFAEALAKMPTYLKFMKEILSKKRKIEDKAIVALTEECSAIIQNKLPPKLQDPGSFSIPVKIGSLHFNNVLCDLGASINLLPLSIFRKLGLEKVKPTNMILQLADRSINYPYGIVEDVLVKVDKFYFPVDFVVVDIDEDKEVPLILGRPFLATSKALIDMEEGVMSFRVGNEKVTFHVLKRIEGQCEPEKGQIKFEKGDDGKADVGRMGKDRICGRFDPKENCKPN